MMRRGIGRVGRPSLIGTAARTAVIAGTATAVSGRVAANQQAKAMAQQAPVDQTAYQPVETAPAPQAAPTAGPSQEDIEMLKQLAELHAQGILTDEEFAAKKGQILGL